MDHELTKLKSCTTRYRRLTDLLRATCLGHHLLNGKDTSYLKPIDKTLEEYVNSFQNELPI